MEKKNMAKKLLPLLFTAFLASWFFMTLVLLDKIMEKVVSLSTRMAASHAIIASLALIIIYLLPGGPGKWGINLKNWQKGLTFGIIFGVVIGILISLFSCGLTFDRWNFARLIAQLNLRENIIQLLSQVFLVGLSEELFFRGLLTTYLMRRYSMKLINIHIGVIIVSLMFASLQFYKLLFGASLVNVLPLVVGAFLYGLLLGWMYQKTQSLLGPVITHNLANSIMFFISLGILN